MADTFIGMDIGDKMPVDITVASSTTSKAVEVRILVGTTSTRLAALEALEAAMNKIRTSPVWPPANT